MGEVENPGTFDSDEQKSSVNEGKNPPETDQPRDLDEPIGDDGVNYDVYADDVNTADANTVDAKDMNFSAEDIRKKKKTEFFVNIKNADKIKRAEEKRKAAEEKRILAEARRSEKEAKRAEKLAEKHRKDDQKYDDSQEKNARKELRNEQRLEHKAAVAEHRKKSNTALRHGIRNFFWRGWRKYVLFAFIIALAIFGFFTFRSFSYYYANIFPKEQKLNAAVEEKKEREKTTNDFFTEIGKLYNNGQGDGYNKACTRAEELIEEAKKNNDNESLFDYSLLYASFVLSHADDTDTALKLVKSVRGLADTDVKKAALYSKYAYIYSEIGDQALYTYYDKLRQKLEITEGDGDDYKNGGLKYAED